MSVVATIDKQISNYLLQLNPVQKKAVLGIVKAFVDESDADHDEKIARRAQEIENGSVKLYSLEEAEEHAREAYKARRK